MSTARAGANSITEVTAVGDALGRTYEMLDIQDQTTEAYTLQHYHLDRLHERDFVIVDLESTGLNYPAEEIIEMAALPIGELCIQQTMAWSAFIQNTKDIPPVIQEITGITNDDTRAGLPLTDALEKLVSQYPQHVWVAHCGFEFDFPFLNQEYRRLFGAALPVEVLDTKILYAALHPYTKQTVSTDFLMWRYDIDPGLRKRHRADGDVALLAEIFLCIMQEYSEQGKDAIAINRPLTVAKFVLPGA